MVAYYEGKLQTGITSHCHAVPHALSLAEFQPGPCPSPATNATVSDFGDVIDCETDIAEVMVENVRRYILNPDTAAIAAHPRAYYLRRCARTVAKYATKLWQTTAYYRGKCQNIEDKTLPPDGGRGCVRRRSTTITSNPRSLSSTPTSPVRAAPPAA
jgi:hypothetical protein